MFVEIYNYENKEIINHLLEGFILIQSLDNIRTDLHVLCLFDSGSTSMLINQRALPPSINAKTGATQSFTTTQGTVILH